MERHPISRWAACLLLSLAPMVSSGCGDLEPPTAPPTTAPVVSGPSLLATESGIDEREWSEYSSQELWSYIAATDTTAIVGLTMPGKGRGVEDGVIKLTDGEREQGRQIVAALPGVGALRDSRRLPAVRVHVANPGVLTALRQSPYVDYVEPAVVTLPPGWSPFAELGCSGDYYDGGDPWQVIGGDVVPGNLLRMQVHDAWERATGSGITIGLVDTGVDDVNPELNSAFATGQSAGRFIWRDWSEPNWQGPPFWADKCGHGTHMAGAAVAPRNGTNIVGVAYGANLASVRHHQDVWNATDAWAAAEAIDIAADIYGSRIIVMAFMVTNSSNHVSNMITYWYNDDRLFIGAAGTSPCEIPYKGVIFPANYSKVVAVTGLKPNGAYPCEVHRGPEVEMLAFVGQPSVGAQGIGHPYFGSNGASSNAAAVIGGIAALTWSRYPAWSRHQVVQRLKKAMNGFTPYGSWVNAFGAVGGLTGAAINGPALIETDADTTVTYEALWEVASGVSLSWSIGGTTQQVNRFVQKPPPGGEYGFSITLTVTDPTDGRVVTAMKNVLVRNPFPDCPECW